MKESASKFVKNEQSDKDAGSSVEYVLEEQVGFVLRQVNQRHTVIFADKINASLTPTQFAVLVKLNELTVCSQNELGRHTAMDAATIKGVVERLKGRGLVRTLPDKNDKRRLSVELTKKGVKFASEAIVSAMEISDETLAPLKVSERKTLLRLLNKLK